MIHIFAQSWLGRRLRRLALRLRCWLVTWHDWPPGRHRYADGPWMQDCANCGATRKAKEQRP